MKTALTILLGCFTSLTVLAQQQTIHNIINTVSNIPTGKGLSDADITKGLKEALNVGAQKATDNAAKLDGFYKNPLIKIPFPKEVKQVEKSLRGIGINKPVDDFIRTMNRAAEDASKSALPIFVNAITSLSIQDGLRILQGGDTAATAYLRTQTSGQLGTSFKPIITQATSKAQVTKHWTAVTKQYNKIGIGKKVNPDLNEYITQQALKGLFLLVGQEEIKIRKDPMARINEILKKVFGS